MGNFYVNFAARGADQGAVASALRAAQRRAFIAPTTKEVTMFFEERADSQDDNEIRTVGQSISRDLHAPVLTVLNHDDDILAYWLFDAGKLLDQYNSFPGYFTDGEHTPSGGDARKLCAAFNVQEVDELAMVLRDEEYAFALERHEALCQRLRIPWSYACLGYGYIKARAFPIGVNEQDFMRTD